MSERPIFGHACASQARLGPGQALALFVATFALLPTLGGWLQVRFGLGGIVGSELLIVLLPTLLALRLARVPAAPALGLSPPSAGAVAGAALLSAGGFYLVAGGLEVLQERWVPLPGPLREELHRLLVPPSGARPLAVDLLALAVTPALCEELLFRGALLRALAPHGRAFAVLATSLLFGFFHFSPYKLLPTASLGALFAVLALRSASLWPAVIAHACNNALVIVLSRAGFDDPPGARSPSAPLLLVSAAAAAAAGIALVRPRAKK